MQKKKKKVIEIFESKSQRRYLYILVNRGGLIIRLSVTITTPRILPNFFFTYTRPYELIIYYMCR